MLKEIFNPITWLMAFMLSSSVLISGVKGAIYSAGFLVAMYIFLMPRFGLVTVIVAVLNFQSMGRLGSGGSLFPSIAKILGVITFLSWIIYLFKDRKKIYFSREILFGAIFLLYNAVSITYAISSEAAIITLTKLLTDFMLFMLIANLIYKVKHLKIILFIIICTGVVASSVAIFQYISPVEDISGWDSLIHFGQQEGAVVNHEKYIHGAIKRPSGTLGHHNWLSLFLVSIVSIGIFFMGATKKKILIFFMVSSISVDLVAVVLTHDRLGFLGVMFVGVLLLSYKIIKINRSILGVVMIFSIMSLFILPKTYIERLFSYTANVQSESTSSRMELLKVGADIIMENPFFGVGYGNYGYAFMKHDSVIVGEVNFLIASGSSYQITDLGAHNMYLELICENGIIGFVIFLLFIISVYQGLFLSRKINSSHKDFNDIKLAATLIIISLSGFFFCSVFLHSLEQKILWILLGISVSICRIARECDTSVLSHESIE